MKRPEHDDLLKEILADEGLETFRTSSLDAGLTILRARRRNRNIRLCILTAAPLLALAAVLFWRGHPEEVAPRQVMAVAPAATNPVLKIYPAPNVADGPPIKIITDAELLALFPNRPVGLIGEPGRQRLVFFDQPGAAE
jgi:hypothetical protein